ncbi:mannose-1-phosphate guanylyltransferase/mannose-6-phosphate isomerase [Marinobacter sp. ATCH36]|uniref:mannose-1-phosphate guanylyltransferase/mannose-6-phosphate isomerase n=1 Tax=Marinobacter sp. ATCH36 TaxID=2945106 RepID=UPI002020DEB1|nr:mannose-1-phosphate guanylyltransferase/mannose-6-phosphate isomerase [Marinobacter sp. ATCH36]MCL7945135.1 mannose-1-phosphate guanylyltransferase/mannose-6-phosphate isomerase [Marinobacter sp. ATCH36]
MIYPVIMAGGNGTRLWPMSRQAYPKQFLSLTGSEHSMLQETVRRLEGLNVAESLLICNEEHRFLAAEQMRQLGHLDHNIILEPAGRNTAPAIALAALTARQKNPEALLLVLAADHTISDPDAFRDSVKSAVPLANEGELLTFGIVPTHPETGYGYIRRGEPRDCAYSVAEFVEKPDAEAAQNHLDSGNYYWNSGMFLFRADTYLEELRTFRPDILEACESAFNDANEDLDFIRVNEKAFLACPSESVDYAVMEHTKRALVVPLDAGWSDVGSWSAIWDIAEKDMNGNANLGDVLNHRSSNNLVMSENALVATVGVNDLVVVQTKDSVLVAHKNHVQDVKHLVDTLKQSDRPEYRLHREVYRPWGRYDSVDKGTRYQVKRITVKPGEKLSVQMHHHRAEHWIVVSGTASVTVDDATTMVTENESVYIPVGKVHSLENPGRIPLELIEVQSGSYLGEDDIVRFEDRYGRS